MSRQEKEIIERLGPLGLVRVLDDLLDQGRLVRLANACGLSYPGMRTRTQKRKKILGDLAERASGEAATRKAILKTLKKECAGGARKWAALSEEDRSRIVRDDAFLRRKPNLGLHLYLIATDGEDGDDVLPALLARCAADSGDSEDGPDTGRGPSPGRASATDAEREAARLAKKNTELRKKVQYLESQLRKTREAEKGLRRDLIERKGELAESRMLAERLRLEIAARDDRRERAGNGVAESDGETLVKRIESLARAVRKIETGQKRLTHAVEKSQDAAAAQTAPSEDPPLQAVLDGVAALRRDVTSRRRERTRERAVDETRHDEVLTTVRALGSRLEPSPGVRSTGKRKGPGDRVGVFVDVQNVYYGARQLKGKLDFDALLQAAVRDRRMILAKAYLVESKEIDQSGFINILQQRAIQVRRKTLRVRSDGSMKGDWDMEMALDILDAAPGLDVVVLVSGDGDFTSLVSRVKELGPRVEVISFPRTAAKSLIETADHFQPLDRKLMIRTENGGTVRRSKRSSAKKAPSPSRRRSGS